MNLKSKILIGLLSGLSLFSVAAVSVSAENLEQTDPQLTSQYWEKFSSCHTIEDELKLLGYDMMNFEDNGDLNSYYSGGYINSNSFNTILLGCTISKENNNMHIFFYSPDDYLFNSLDALQIHYKINGNAHHALIQTSKSYDLHGRVNYLDDSIFGEIDTYGTSFVRSHYGLVPINSYESSLNDEDGRYQWLPYDDYSSGDLLYGVECVEISLSGVNEIFDDNICDVVIDGFSFYDETDIFDVEYGDCLHAYFYLGYHIKFHSDLGIIEGGNKVLAQECIEMELSEGNFVLKETDNDVDVVEQVTSIQVCRSRVETINIHWKTYYKWFFTKKTKYYRSCGFFSMVNMDTGERITNAKSVTFKYSYKGEEITTDKNVRDMSNVSSWQAFKETWKQNNDSNYCELFEVEDTSEVFVDSYAKYADLSFDPEYCIYFGCQRTGTISDLDTVYVTYEVAGENVYGSFYENGLHAVYNSDGTLKGIYDKDGNLCYQYIADENGVLKDSETGNYIPISYSFTNTTVVENDDSFWENINPFKNLLFDFKNNFNSILGIIRLSLGIISSIFLVFVIIKLYRFMFNKRERR